MVVFKDDPLGFYSDELFPRYIFDLLPEFHNCFLFEEILNFIDTREIETGYSPIGQRAYHPKLITKILIYSYSQGVFSSRQIEKRCKEDLGFMYISHMNCPNFRVLSDFRKDNYKFFKDCFKKSVELALGMGLVSLGHVSLDGSKFQADTSKHKAMSYKRMLEKEKELTEEIGVLLARAKECDEEEDMEYGDKTGYEISEDLKIKEKRLKKIQSAREALEKREQELNPGKKIEDKKQISFADKEAKIMGKKGNFDYNYNGQISVDSDNQIIIGEHVSQNANDKKEAKPAIEEIKENTGEVPDKMSSDNGYFSGENIEAFENENIDVYMATGKGEPQDDTTDEDSGKLKKNQFSYDIEKDVFVCPNGKTLKLKSHNKDGKKIYQAQKEDCDNCPFQKRWDGILFHRA